jgi:hypothetical protein
LKFRILEYLKVFIDSPFQKFETLSLGSTNRGKYELKKHPGCLNKTCLLPYNRRQI